MRYNKKKGMHSTRPDPPKGKIESTKASKKPSEFWVKFDLDKFFKDANKVGEILIKKEEDARASG